MPDVPSSGHPGPSDVARSGGASPAYPGTTAADDVTSGLPGAPRRPADIELVVTPDADDPAAYPTMAHDQTAGLPWRDEPDGTHEPGPSRRRRIVWGTALAVGLLGAVGVGTVGLRIAGQKDTTLETPNQVAGLVRDDSERAHETAEYLRTAFAAGIDLEQSIGAVYADPGAADRSVLLFGGTALLWQPDRDLERLFELVADDGEQIKELRELSPGALGGVLQCGTTPAQEGDIAVCGWADHGSVVLAMFPGRQVEESAELLRQIRSEIQTRE